MYSIITTSQFEKDMLRAKKQKKNMTELARVLLLLENGEKLPEKDQNHKLKNIKQETWDCHIQPDWLLLYEIDKKQKKIKLKRIGSHTELFK